MSVSAHASGIFFFNRYSRSVFRSDSKKLNSGITDDARIDELRRFIGDNFATPFFAHVQLVGTHGSKFDPPDRLFSKDKEQTEKWMVDFYDDAIRHFDKLLENVYDHLVQRQVMENTIIVVSSDHGIQYTFSDRLPLIFRFPNQQYYGRLIHNTQRMDIAPTILDYLQVKIPNWMEGQSHLNGDQGLEMTRSIYSGTVGKVEVTEKGWFEATEL